MRILVICSGTRGKISPFIKEQMISLAEFKEIEFFLFQIKKKGLVGYLSHLPGFLKSIEQFRPDLIHAHYGFSGLLANMQRRVPVLTTFHGSDVNNKKNLKWSKCAHKLSAASIFVEESMIRKFKKHQKSFTIPCAVDLEIFFAIPKIEAQRILGIQNGSPNILFSSDFENPIKNYHLARKSCDLVEQKTGKKINLIEMKGLTRSLVNLYMNASDCALLFSYSEGSPQFIKEAMACNCPIVATDVGDIKYIFGDTKGCFISAPQINVFADKIISALEFSSEFGRTNGRERIEILGLDTQNIAKKILNLYYNCLKLS